MPCLLPLAAILMLSYPVPDPILEAETLRKQGRLLEAEFILHAALETFDQSGRRDLRLAFILNNLASVSGQLGRHDQSEKLYKRCISLWRELGMAQTPHFVRSLDGLMTLYLNTAQYGKASMLYRAELKALERIPGLGGAEQSRTLHKLGILAHVAGRKREAEDFYLHALRLLEHCRCSSGTQLPSLLNSLAMLRFHSRRSGSSLDLLSRARRIVEEDLGPESPELISILTNYGLYVKGNAESDAALARALHIAESTLGVGHPVTAEVLISYAERLRKSGRKPEARLFEARAKAILDSHPDTHRRKHTVDFLELLGNCERYDPLACR